MAVSYNLEFDSENNLVISEDALAKLNSELEKLEAVEILKWATTNFEKVYQETAFGPSGNVILDMLSGIGAKVPLIFIDTLFNFDETIELSNEIVSKYGIVLHTFYPSGAKTREEFIEKYGDNLWAEDSDVYDYLVKAEPGQRAYKELSPGLVITGRRRSQKGEREALPVLQVIPANEEAGSKQVVKLNPLVSKEWTYQKVKSYLKAFNVPYNKLLDKGYKSIGDYHSTSPVGEDGDERSGRWQGSDKTECGLHKDYFSMKKMYNERMKKANDVTN
ncbi:Phosphoadenosine phosphosulfate reductase [Smittium culicis]|uniref:Phosphoadenosine phosphosulfate reductase n=1 Tax=Smittium culicis TaxID=133412 RepID=A0A1R1XTD9_9FUNG|nr:Phosphoadenosine phosphosulfate reductase [Smittium culicis]